MKMKSFEQCLCDQVELEDSVNAERSYSRVKRRGEKEARKIKRKAVCAISAMFATIAIFHIIAVYGLPEEKEHKYTPTKEEATVVATGALQAEPKMIWKSDVPLDNETQLALYEACEEFDVPYEVALAVIKQETNFQNVMGDNGDSYGYMQLQPKWVWPEMLELGVQDLMVPENNFRVGCLLLSTFYEDYGNWTDALTRYNTGSAGESSYATSVLSYMEEFE